MDQPQEMPQEQAPQEDSGALVTRLTEDMAKLTERVLQSPAVSDEDKAELGEIMNRFASFLERNRAEEGGEPQAVPVDEGVLPAMGGAKGVPMGPQGRN